MSRVGLSACIGISLFSLIGPVLAQNPERWTVRVEPYPQQNFVYGSDVGVLPGSTDGYGAGDSPGDVPWWPGVGVGIYHVKGSDWTGWTGFYLRDARSPIPWGGSKTWDNIYLWAQGGYEPPGGRYGLRFAYYDMPPPGYTATLVLDYVPDWLGWTGPMEFPLDITTVSTITSLPVPMVTDPLQGTRMHLTVYAPIPEPSSLAGLGLAAVGLATTAWRRQRRTDRGTT